MATVTDADVRAALARVEEPETHRPVTDLGMVRGVVVRPGAVGVVLAAASSDDRVRERLRAEATAAVRTLGVERVDVDVRPTTDEESRRLRRRLQGQRPADAARVFEATRVIAVASGKGGVGKSSVSSNLAVALARRGRRVAILDADVYGFSIPRMIGIDRKPTIVDNLVIPPEAHGVAVVSVALFADEQTPVIWRGPMLHKMLQQFVTDVYWGSPDFLVVDMPPGTGDVSLTIAEFLPAAEILVVTTPQPAAQKVAQRAAYMAQKINLRVSGVVENMSWFTGNDGVRYELFGSGGGELLAQQLGVPLLGSIPLLPALREGGDVGRPVIAAKPDSEAAAAIDAVAGRLVAAGRSRATLPIVNVPL